MQLDVQARRTTAMTGVALLLPITLTTMAIVLLAPVLRWSHSPWSPTCRWC